MIRNSLTALIVSFILTLAIVSCGKKNQHYIEKIIEKMENGGTSEEIVEPVVKAVQEQLEKLPRKEITEKALLHSRIILLKDDAEVIRFTNQYAPEHLIIQTNNYDFIADQITNAGSVFMGAYTPESAGDYASGTNHTLPTNGYARSYSGVNLDSFIKKITFQEITKEGIRNLGNTIEVMAAGEQLDAHRNAVTIRLSSL